MTLHPHVEMSVTCFFQHLCRDWCQWSILSTSLHLFTKAGKHVHPQMEPLYQMHCHSFSCNLHAIYHLSVILIMLLSFLFPLFIRLHHSYLAAIFGCWSLTSTKSMSCPWTTRLQLRELRNLKHGLFTNLFKPAAIHIFIIPNFTQWSLYMVHPASTGFDPLLPSELPQFFVA